MSIPVDPVEARHVLGNPMRILVLEAALTNTASAERRFLQHLGFRTSWWHDRDGDLGRDVLALIERHLEPTPAQRERQFACRLVAVERRGYFRLRWDAEMWEEGAYYPEPATEFNGQSPTSGQHYRAECCMLAALERRETVKLSKQRLIREKRRRATLRALGYYLYVSYTFNWHRLLVPDRSMIWPPREPYSPDYSNDEEGE